MTISTARAALTAAFLLGAASGAAYAADKPPAGPKLTPAVQKHLIAAQTANGKKDFAGALAELDAANQTSGITPADQVMINRMKMAVHVAQKDYAAADVDAEAVADADPSAIGDADRENVYRAAILMAIQSNHGEKAFKYTKILAGLPGPHDLLTQQLMAQGLYMGGDYQGAVAQAQKAMDAATAAGKRPDKNLYEIKMSAYVKLNDQPNAQKTTMDLIAAYNDPEDWGRLLPATLGAKGTRDIDYVYIGRLWAATGAKIDPADISLIGSTDSRLTFYGDAVAAQKLGATGFPPADAKAEADKKTIGAQIAAGAKQNGEYNVKIAEALIGYGMFADAEKMARDAKAKGGAKDPIEPDMVLGQALFGQGKYAEAATVFGGVQYTNPASQRIAELWTILAKNKANPPAPAPAQ